MENPFHAPNIVILREAFPLVEVRVIDDALWSAKGDVNHAFELLLAMNSANGSLSPPPLPVRRSNSSNAAYATSAPNTRIIPTETNPFLLRGSAKPLTVREELAKWRQDLQEESRQRTINTRSAASTPNLSLSNMFRSNPSRASLPNRRPEQIHITHRQAAHGSLQRPGIYHSPSIPNVRYQYHSRSSSSPLTALPPSPDTTNNIAFSPALPERRRQSSNSTSSSTNPFLSGRPLPSLPRPEVIPPINPNHREPIVENDTSTFNPFEEAELPPPAYCDIQKDTVIDLAP